MVLLPTQLEKYKISANATFSNIQESCLWLSSHRDLNPLDYAIWDVLEHAINRTSHSNVDSLKDNIKEEWEKLSPKYLRDTCASFQETCGGNY